MASQNLPGFAVLRASGYKPPARSILAVTGLGSLLTAPLGALTTNLAAISAAICTGPDTHADVDKRWPTGLFYGAIYLVFAAFGASLVALFAALPGEVIRSIAGLALLGPLVGALGGAMADLKTRLPAVLTLVVTASGVSAFSIGSAFWGLCAGLAALALERGMTVLRTGKAKPASPSPRNPLDWAGAASLEEAPHRGTRHRACAWRRRRARAGPSRGAGGAR